MPRSETKQKAECISRGVLLSKHVNCIMTLWLVIIYLMGQGVWMDHLAPFKVLGIGSFPPSSTFRAHGADLHTFWAFLRLQVGWHHSFILLDPFFLFDIF